MAGTVDSPRDPMQDQVEAPKRSAVAYLQVSGMGCKRCVGRVRSSLQRLDGVSFAEISLDTHLAGVLYDPHQVTPSNLVGAVAAAGNDGFHQYRAEFLAQMPAELTGLGWS